MIMKREVELQRIEKINGGDTGLYNELVNFHSPKILSIVRGVVRNREDAEEIAQDVFVKAYFSLSGFRGECSFSTWLFRIAYNMSISKARTKKRDNIPCENMGHIPDNSIGDIFDHSEKDKMMRIMYLAIDSLNKEDRFIILSFYNHEKSIREISEICRMSESNVKVKLHRIKKRLSVLIGDKIDLCYG